MRLIPRRAVCTGTDPRKLGSHQTTIDEGRAMELHSEIESYRATIGLRTPDGERATVIIMHRGQNVWVTLNGAIRTTVVMSDPEAGHLVDVITTARSPR
jgi:hypothetical protein